MNRKPGAFPFVHSQIALLIFSLTVVGRPAYAEPNEAPAVLQFARKYQQEQTDIPRYKPSKKAPQSERKGSSVPEKPVLAPVVNQPLITEPERRQLLQIKGQVAQKEQEIAAQSQTIQKLEKQLSTLQQAADKASAAVAAIPAASPQDVQMVQNMIESLYRTFTLRPAPGTLAENLKQANQRAANARLAEAAMQEKQKELKLQLDELQNKIVVLKNSRSQSENVRETSLSTKLEMLNKQKDRLESDLATSRQKATQASAQVQQLENSMRKLESENKQLMLQISGHSSVSETLERVKKQQNKLQDELATRQQQLTDLENEKQQLQQQLTAAPTPAQLADSQQQVVKLKNQLDASAQLLQKQERSATEQAKLSSEMLIAEKKSAEDKIKVLQEKLAASQIQQAALQSEQQQLQQKLQNNLLSKEKNSAVIAVQLKELQDKLTAAQHQQTVLLADKEKLQRQLEHAPTSAQLADSQQRVKALQSELDASAQLLQKQERSATEQAKLSSEMLTAEKKSAEDKIKVLQEKLAASQIQQADLQSEQQQLQKKLQNNLLSKEENSAVIAVQLKELQDKLTAAQHQQTALLADKEKLQRQLEHAPTSAQLADSQQRVKALQSELDASAQLLQKQERSATEQAKLSSEMLIAEKKSAEDKIKVLQEKLAASQIQQAALQSEQQQLQQKLQNNLLSKEKNSAVIAVQLKELQDKLTAAQHQQTALLADKEKLQRQLEHAPTSAQLADSQQRVKALQSELDANAILLQKEIGASQQVKASNVVLLAEKQLADNTIKALQEKLNALQIQQTALLAEKQEFQQKLQGELKSNEQHSSALSAQMKELQDKLAAAEQQRKAVVDEKEQLQHQLEKAPTEAQMADSQQKIKALQAQLDTAMLLQKKGSITSEQIQASNATLMKEKAAAEDKVKSLQKELSAVQAQYAAIRAEKLQSQQKLQSDLKDNDENHAALVMQLKELQDKLVSAQEQQNAVQSEKDKLQHQLDNVPGTAQLADSQLKIKALQVQLDTALMLQKKAVSTGGVAKTDDSMHATDYKVAENKIKELQLKLDATQAELTEVTKQSASSKAKGLVEVTTETLKKKSTREAYAIGVSLGTEILQLQAENRNWASTDSDKPSVLAGIIDSFQGKEKLPPAELHKALMNISERVKSGREKYMGDLDKSTKKFIDNFTKQKNAKKSESGFWYRIGYTGDTPIPAGATIDVVVKESLANGMVVEDMDAKGIVLSQPISAFPPVFREALSKLKNHGSITIVVPPALAYGDKGYPPKVPPNATMVYDLRVSDVYPEREKK